MGVNYVYLNGRVVPEEQAAIGAHDAGFLHGASAFTTMLAHNGVVFRLDRHLDRLLDTVQFLGLRTDVTKEQLAAGVKELLVANGMLRARDGQDATGARSHEASTAAHSLPVRDALVAPTDEACTAAHNAAVAPEEPTVAPNEAAVAPQGEEARVRITLTPGSIHGGAPTTLITAEPVPEHYRQWREKGITVVISSLKQATGDPAYGYKTGCYLPRILAYREAAAKGAQEALWFTQDNRLSEACFRNVWLVLKGEALTPPPGTPVLPGIVRQAVLELCGELGVPFDDRSPLTVREMLAAEEVFLTGSVLGVCPVVRIERHAVGDEKPGVVTKKIMSAYEQLVERECSQAGERLEVRG